MGKTNNTALRNGHGQVIRKISLNFKILKCFNFWYLRKIEKERLVASMIAELWSI